MSDLREHEPKGPEWDRLATLNQAGPEDPDLEIEKAAKAIYLRRFGEFKHAIINALPHEFAAIEVLFGPFVRQPSTDPSNSFEAAELTKETGERIKIAIAEVTGPGLTGAAISVALCKSRLPYLHTVLLVGIAAGQPAPKDPERDVWLGDIVISKNVVQYDHISRKASGDTCRGDKLPTPSPRLLAVSNALKAEMEKRSMARPGAKPWPWEEIIARGILGLEGSDRPGVEADPQFPKRKYPLDHGHRKGATRPHLHIGTIGSANMLLRYAKFRNQLAKQHKTIAYEMEGAGVALAAQSLDLQYLIVRGICDYADAKKEDKWQRYASVAAASVAHLILEKL